MTKPEKLEQGTIALLQSRLLDEFNAFALYRSATNYCQNVGFFKASEFFKAESSDELEHAKNIENYLTQWNVTPILPTIPAPEVNFKGLSDIIEKAYEIELSLLEKYVDSSSKLFKAGDLATFDFLQEFRKIQNDSVAEYSDKINVLEGVNVGSKFEMLMLEETLFEG